MQKRNIVLAVLALLIVSAAVYFVLNNPFSKQIESSNQAADITGAPSGAETGTEETSEEPAAGGESTSEAVSTEAPAEEEEEIVKSKNIEVFHNSIQYDLKAAACLDRAGTTFLKLEYY